MDVGEARKTVLIPIIRQIKIRISVRVVRSKASHFALQLHLAMKGLGTDDDTLVRVIVSRSEVDMVQVKEEFQRNFKQSLHDFIVVSFYEFPVLFDRRVHVGLRPIIY